MLFVTVFIYQLIVCEFLFRSVRGSWRTRRSSNLVCPRGCTACSRVNGCITCEGRLFMFLSRQNMRETGICLHSCPAGYYGVRHAYYSKCYRCHIPHCQICFDRTFCSLCEEPYLASEGQCLDRCPEGQYYANYTRECQTRVDCLLGAWSPWSDCTRNGQTCGFRFGFQTRTRQSLQDASPNGTPCSQLTDTQRCRLQRRQCDEAHNGGTLTSELCGYVHGPRNGFFSLYLCTGIFIFIIICLHSTVSGMFVPLGEHAQYLFTFITDFIVVIIRKLLFRICSQKV